MKISRMPLMPMILALICLIVTAGVFAQTIPPADQAPRPTPPMQGKPWTPPATKLPPVVVSAITELFDQGMADPRGCEYREIEIADRGIGNRKFHGWVLPGLPGLPGEEKTRYAIGWNGLVYPVAEIGAVADLRQDFSSTNHGGGRFRGNGVGWPMSDAGSLAQTLALPIRVAFLLRLGEVELAERLWKEGCEGNDELAEKDPYLNMASVWIGRWYFQIVKAYLRGDFLLAAQMSRALLPLQKTVEATAARRGIPKPSPDGLYLPEIRQLPELAVEAERRAKEPPYIPVLKSGTPAKDPERIAALIRDLELVKGMQLSVPGETKLDIDPIVQALISEGEPAVEPLIACLESDTRLTDTLYTINMGGVGPIIRVYEPAYLILSAILKTTVIIPLHLDKSTRELSPDDRKALAAKFHDYWAKYKSLPPAERWFSVLQDDNATPHEWFEAAANIVQLTNQTSMGPNLFSGGGWSAGYPGSTAPMRGESLRNKSNPSVSELLIKRFNQLLSISKPDTSITFTSMGNLLYALADWDGKAHIDDLREMTRQFNAKYADADEGFDSTVKINATLYEKRIKKDDPTALAEYAHWVSSLRPESYFVQDVFKIMWEHPDSAVIQKAARDMFAGRNAPWQAVAIREGRESFSFCGLINTPMLGLQAYREQVLLALADTTVVGYARHYDGGEPIHLKDDNSENPQPDAPPKVDFRLCDYYASTLAKVQNFPECKLTWPLEKRDAAVEACKSLLMQYGAKPKLTQKTGLPASPP